MSESSEKMDQEREEQTSETLTFWDLIGKVKNEGNGGDGYGGEVVDNGGKG